MDKSKGTCSAYMMNTQRDLLSNRRMKPLKFDILDYWKNSYKNAGEFKALVQVILSISASHLTWKQISNMYWNLKDTRLECNNAILVDLNYDLLKCSDSTLWSNLCTDKNHEN